MALGEGVLIMKGMIIFGLCALFFTFAKANLPFDENRETMVKNAAQKVSGSGIVFFNTTRLEELKDFYINRVGCKMWIDQGSCAILRHGNLLIGFCSGKKSEPDAVVTFFYKSREEVDAQYEKFKSIAIALPKDNQKYRIYHFYARDPDGRSIEFQYFNHTIDWDFGKY